MSATYTTVAAAVAIPSPNILKYVYESIQTCNCVSFFPYLSDDDDGGGLQQLSGWLFVDEIDPLHAIKFQPPDQMAQTYKLHIQRYNEGRMRIAGDPNNYTSNTGCLFTVAQYLSLTGWMWTVSIGREINIISLHIVAQWSIKHTRWPVHPATHPFITRWPNSWPTTRSQWHAVHL